MPKAKEIKQIAIQAFKDFNLKLLNDTVPYINVLKNLESLAEKAQSEVVKTQANKAILEEYGRVRQLELKSPQEDIYSQEIPDDVLDNLIKQKENQIIDID